MLRKSPNVNSPLADTTDAPKSLLRLFPLEVGKAGRPELLRRHPANRVVDAGRAREERHPELPQRAPADLGEADLQHHLLTAGAAGQLEQVDDLQLRRPWRAAISAARSETWLLDTWPDRITASPLALTRMSSPGKSC